MVGKGIGDAITILLIGSIIGVVLLVGVGAYGIYKVCTDEVITVEDKVEPKPKLVTDGTTVDTVWVYTFE